MATPITTLELLLGKCLAAAIPAVITGSLLIDALNLTGALADIGETHESLGIMTMSVALLAPVVRAIRRNKLSGLWAYGYGVLIAGALVLVVLTGHYGGLLAWPNAR